MMSNSRYINDMIIRYYTLTKAIREVTEDHDTFYTPEDRYAMVNSLAEERKAIKKMLDMDLADSVGNIKPTRTSEC